MLNSDVVKGALRGLGVVGGGREPSNSQATEGVNALEGLIASFTEGLLGSPWIESDITSDVTAEENDRLRVNSQEPVTIYLPVTTSYRERVVDQCGCITVEARCSDARAPLDGSKVWICDVFGTITPLLYLYRADRGEWVRGTSLAYGETCPLGPQHKLGLIGLLAEALSADYGVELSSSLAKQAAMGRLGLASRSGLQRTVTPAEYF